MRAQKTVLKDALACMDRPVRLGACLMDQREYTREDNANMCAVERYFPRPMAQ